MHLPIQGRNNVYPTDKLDCSRRRMNLISRTLNISYTVLPHSIMLFLSMRFSINSSTKVSFIGRFTNNISSLSFLSSFQKFLRRVVINIDVQTLLNISLRKSSYFVQLLLTKYTLYFYQRSSTNRRVRMHQGHLQLN